MLNVFDCFRLFLNNFEGSRRCEEVREGSRKSDKVRVGPRKLEKVRDSWRMYGKSMENVWNKYGTSRIKYDSRCR